MAQTIKLKRSATPSAIPSTASLSLGEVAINTYDGKMFIKKDDGTEAIVEIGSGGGGGVSSFADNAKLTFGDSADLEIFHDGSASFITDTGTGNLRIQGTNLALQNAAGTKNYLLGIDAGATTVYYDNAAKLATTSTGIDVTGTATMDGLTVSGTTDATEELARFGNSTGAQELIIEQQGTSGYAIKSSVDLRLHADYDNDTSDGGSNIEMYTDGTQRMSITGSTGDISFYEDTGTTPKLQWSASNERLFLSGSDFQFGIVQGANQPWYTRAVSDGSYRLHLNNTGDIVTLDSSGNVGIGTSSPAYPLEVQSGGVGTVLRAGTSFLSIDSVGSAAAPSLIFNGDANTGIWRPASDTLAVSTAGGERMRIDSSGNVGIGTQPSTYLTNGYVLRLNGGTQTYLAFNNSSKTTQVLGGFVIGHDVNAARITQRENDPIIIATNNTERMRIDASGNAIVGGTSAQASDAVTLMSDGEVTAAGFYFSNNIGVAMNSEGIRRPTTGSIAFDTGSTERMRINSVGNVNIGRGADHTDSTARLAVFNSGASESYTIRPGTNVSNQIDILSYNYGTNTYLPIRELASSWIWFSGDAGERARIDTSGKLLIGTTHNSLYNSSTQAHAGALVDGANDNIQVARWEGTPLFVNRMSTDGNLVDLRKDGTTVGSIGNDTTALYVTGASTGIKFGSSAIWAVSGGGSTNANGTKDLGASTAKWKDLYLSGIVTASGGTSTNWNTAYGWGDHSTQSYATQSYVGTAISNLVDSAPGTLDTLNELAAALGDDPNFATTVTNSIAGKVSKSGDTMSSDLIINSVGANNNAAATDNIKVSGYGIVGNRSTFYVTNNGTVQIGVGGTHNNNSAMTFGTSSNVSQKTLYENSNRVFTDGYHPNADTWTTARTLSLTGAVTGSTSIDGSGNVSIATTATADPTLTLAGDATGSATFTNLGNATLTVTVADDSHNHVISNVDGLQTALDAKLASSSYTAADVLTKVKTVDGTGSGLDADLLDGVEGSGYFRTGRTLGSINTISNGGDRYDPSASNPTNEHYAVLTYGNGANVTGQLATHFQNGATYNRAYNTSWSAWSRMFDDDYHPNADKWTTARTLSLTGAVTGSVSMDGSGNVSLATTATSDPVITLTGAVTGSGTMTNLGNVSITTTATADPTLTLAGDASGSATFTNLGNATLTVTVADDSHNHVISNVDGLQTALDSKLNLTGGTLSGGLDITGNLNAVDNIYLAGSLYHEGDTDTRLLFDTNTITLQTAGSSEVTVNASGVRLGDTGNGYFQPVTGSFGSIQIDGGDHGGYEGLNIGGRAVFMHNNANNTGIYNDVDNHWLVNCVHNAEVTLYFGGAAKLETTNTGVNITGALTATSKSFVIDHPTKPDMKLRYGSLEGPENGVYVRGRLKDNNVIELPDYWTGLVHEDSITVNLTAIGKGQELWVEDVAENKVTVGGENINCFYTVFAERKDVERFEVEYEG